MTEERNAPSGNYSNGREDVAVIREYIYSTIYEFTGVSEAGKQWIFDNIDSADENGYFIAEHSYAQDIMAALCEEGYAITLNGLPVTVEPR